MTSDDIAAAETSMFVNDGWIDEVLFAVKSGKEATVFCCKASPGRDHAYFALKVYKPREHRNFRNDAVYREGRVIPDARMARAIRNKSTKGRAFQFDGWLQHEFAMLSQLHKGGADVPRPFAIGPNAILIEFVGEGQNPAPQLNSVRLSPAVAEVLLDQALRNIEIMLAHHVVHGDLSAYNMLYAGDRLRVIDMPQAVDARSNQNARTLLARDVANVCRYFASQGADADPGTYASDLWNLYTSAEL